MYQVKKYEEEFKSSYAMGLSINDITVLGCGRGQLFCYNSTKASKIKKSVTMGGRGSKNVQNRDWDRQIQTRIKELGGHGKTNLGAQSN
jgi:hypothetical protein